jgi:alpha-galactosidase
MEPMMKCAGRIVLPAVLAVLALTVSAYAAPKKGPVKVFILAGQSNMDGQADVRTIDFLGEDPDPARAALLKKFKPDGKNLTTRDDVWVTSGDVSGDLGPGYGGRRNYSKLGNCIGPEYSFGYYMGEASENQVLLIKYAPGGQSLYQNFRPPSAGLPNPVPMKTLPDKTKVPMTAEDFGGQYRGMIAHVHDVLKNLKQRFPSYDEKAGYEVVGFVWFQGFNDLVSGGACIDEYARNLICLIKDVRKEFNAPNMKVVVGVIGVNGVRNEAGKQKALRDAQRSMNAVPEFKGNVKAIESAPLLDARVVDLLTIGWLNKDRDLQKNPLTEDEKAMIRRATSNMGFHYNGEGRFFILLGKAMAEAMRELLGPASRPLVPAAQARPSRPPGIARRGPTVLFLDRSQMRCCVQPGIR